MASLEVDGSELVVRLTRGERLITARGDVRVPLSSVRSAELTATPVGSLRGIRWGGLMIPFVADIGTTRSTAGRDFDAIRNGVPTVVIDLEGASYRRLVVSTPDAAEWAERLDPGRRTESG